MGSSRFIRVVSALVLALVVLLCTPAGVIAPADAQQPPPPPAAAATATAVRLTLVDGRTVDGYLTGGDAHHYFIQTDHGYFSIARANVVAVTPFAPTPSYTPASAPPIAPSTAPAPAPIGPAPEAGRASRYTASVHVAASAYLLTAIIAAARTEEDDDAKYGFLPIAGPILWTTKHDSDDFLEDGYDWLALTSTVVQAGGLVGLFTRKQVRRHSLVHVAPVGTRSYGGLSVAGSW